MDVFDWACGQEKLNLKSSAAAIGNFDGVHLGHIKVINKAKFKAKKINLPLSILTFSPHPREYFSKKNVKFKLQTEKEKKRFLAIQDVDLMINLKFNDFLSNLNPEKFIIDVLVNSLNIKHIFVGKDFRFGKNRVGDVSTLKSVGSINGLGVTDIDIKNLNGIAISSTIIRENLVNGDIEKVNKALGRPYSISGIVVEGDKRGRQINFPTANIKLGNLIYPAYGVYSVKVCGKGLKDALGIANIGVRPTVNDRGKLLEVHLFEENRNLYGEKIEVSLMHFIRNEIKFDGIESLKNQISKDVKKAKSLLKSKKNKG